MADTTKTSYAGLWYDEENAGTYLAWFHSVLHADLEGHDEVELEAREESVTEAERRLLK